MPSFAIGKISTSSLTPATRLEGDTLAGPLCGCGLDAVGAKGSVRPRGTSKNLGEKPNQQADSGGDDRWVALHGE